MLPIKILLLFLILVLFFVCGYFLLRRFINSYHPKLWGLVEAFWYMVSFGALCVGLTELERIEKLRDYTLLEKQLLEDYHNKRNLLHAQTWLLKLEEQIPESERDGTLWFHKIRAYFDEGMNSSRWEGFLKYSSAYIKGEKISDLRSKMLEYGWPQSDSSDRNQLYLKEEILWMSDTLNSFKLRKAGLLQLKPVENTNYEIRYVLIFFFLLALALKFLKIYADYRRNINPQR